MGIIDIAKRATVRYPASDIECALEFLQELLPAFCGESIDRLVKVGRSLRGILELEKELGSSENLQKALELALEECQLLLQFQTDGFQVARRRFGKTELEMPIVTLGCMRFQQQWGPKITSMNQVYSDCQENLCNILKQALAYGITHIETAHGYGCSEMQIGVALKQLFLTGQAKREDLILQTKIPPQKDAKKFREVLEKSFERLQVEYIDLFAFHGLNGEWQWDWLFGGEDNCWKAIQEYVDAGKIKHVGFSTHGPTDLICKLINTDRFAYVNLHHHFCGSYTASGDGPGGRGNIECLRLLKKKDMGAFIISAFDKGGKLYAPSRKLRCLTLPDIEPMTYGQGWLWNLDAIDDGKCETHTLSVGCARPSDLDQCAIAAHYQSEGSMLAKVQRAEARLSKAKEDALGTKWIESCYDGIVKSVNSQHLVEHNQVIWIYNCIQAWGMFEFAKDRYGALLSNKKKFDPTVSLDEAIDKIGRSGWGFVPGLAPDNGVNYFDDDLQFVPEGNRAKYKEVYAFMEKWCSKDSKECPPKEWRTSFEMKPNKDFPDRPYP